MLGFFVYIEKAALDWLSAYYVGQSSQILSDRLWLSPDLEKEILSLVPWTDFLPTVYLSSGQIGPFLLV